jgi:hypothetical protein
MDIAAAHSAVALTAGFSRLSPQQPDGAEQCGDEDDNDQPVNIIHAASEPCDRNELEALMPWSEQSA